MAIVMALEPLVQAEFEKLAGLIGGAKSPSDAVAKAIRAVEMDGLESASDAAVNALLKKAHS